MSLRSEGIQAGETTNAMQTQTGGDGREGLKKLLHEMDSDLLAEKIRTLDLCSDDPVEAVLEFASGLEYRMYEVLMSVLKGESSDEEVVQLLTAPRHLSARMIAMFELGCRYKCDDFTASLLYGPQFVGMTEFSGQAFVNIRADPKKKVIVQAICASGPKFPPSMALVIGDSFVWRGDIGNDVFIDITECTAGKGRISLELKCYRETQWYCIVIRQVTKVSYEELLDEVVQRQLPESVYSVCCPLSSRIMRVPVRSLKCDHSQCYDLKALLYSASPDGKLTCPVCRRSIDFNDLAVDLKMMEILSKQRLNCMYCLMKGIEGK